MQFFWSAGAPVVAVKVTGECFLTSRSWLPMLSRPARAHSARCLRLPILWQVSRRAPDATSVEFIGGLYTRADRRRRTVDSLSLPLPDRRCMPGACVRALPGKVRLVQRAAHDDVEWTGMDKK